MYLLGRISYVPEVETNCSLGQKGYFVNRKKKDSSIRYQPSDFSY